MNFLLLSPRCTFASVVIDVLLAGRLRIGVPVLCNSAQMIEVRSKTQMRAGRDYGGRRTLLLMSASFPEINCLL